MLPSVEHGISQEAPQRSGSERPDLSTFWANVNELDTSNNNTRTEGHPSQVAAVHRQLVNWAQILNGQTEGAFIPEGLTVPRPEDEALHGTFSEMLNYMIETLSQLADNPPSTLQGVPQSFLDTLERVDKSELHARQAKAGSDTADRCPICRIPFLDDKYPLVVQLPCHKEHVFDLECIAPWLKTQTTCPLCRVPVIKQETEKERIDRIVGRNASSAKDAKAEDEEEWDDMYA